MSEPSTKTRLMSFATMIPESGAKSDRDFRAVSGIGMGKGELTHLFGDCIRNLPAAIADIDAVEAGERIEAYPARHVRDVDAFTTRNHAI